MVEGGQGKTSEEVALEPGAKQSKGGIILKEKVDKSTSDPPGTQ